MRYSATFNSVKNKNWANSNEDWVYLVSTVTSVWVTSSHHGWLQWWRRERLNCCYGDNKKAGHKCCYVHLASGWSVCVMQAINSWKHGSVSMIHIYISWLPTDQQLTIYETGIDVYIKYMRTAIVLITSVDTHNSLEMVNLIINIYQSC